MQNVKRCAHCKTTITGPCLTALDASWHPDCFTCTGCRTPLSTGRFIERNGKPLCINCAAPTCAACSSKIANETVLTALGSTYHAGCFVCVKCSNTLGDGGFVIKDGAPHCSTCAAAKCAGCRAPIISGTNIGALNKRWHAACFRCVDCPPSAAALDSFHAGKDGQPYCRVHYDRKYCERCAGCDEPMSSCGTVSVSGRTFHSTCLKCALCSSIVAHDDCFVGNTTSTPPSHEGPKNGRAAIYCRTCYGDKFAERCAACDEGIVAPCKYVTLEGQRFHLKCFRCTSCQNDLSSPTTSANATAAAPSSKISSSTVAVMSSADDDGGLGTAVSAAPAAVAVAAAAAAAAAASATSPPVQTVTQWRVLCSRINVRRAAELPGEKTGAAFRCGEIIDVRSASRKRVKGVTVTFLQLADRSGWIFDRIPHKRKEFLVEEVTRVIAAASSSSSRVQQAGSSKMGGSTCASKTSASEKKKKTKAKKVKKMGTFAHEGLPYCENCYRVEFGTRCGCCGEGQMKWVVTGTGQKLCTRCSTDEARCFSCDFAVGPEAGGCRALEEDDRVVCRTCDATAITALSDATEILADVQRFFTSIGFSAFTDSHDASAILRPDEVPLRLESQPVLRALSLKNGRVGIHASAPLGLCMSSMSSRRKTVVETQLREEDTPTPLKRQQGGRLESPEKVVKRTIHRRSSLQVEVETIRRSVLQQRIGHAARLTPLARPRRTSVETTTSTSVQTHRIDSIAVLNGMPRIQLSAVLAHELCHAFLRLLRFPDLDRKSEEGMCELWSHLWLSHVAATAPRASAAEATTRLKRLHANTNPIYGDGLREALAAYERAQQHRGQAARGGGGGAGAKKEEEKEGDEEDGGGEVMLTPRKFGAAVDDGGGALDALTAMLKKLRRTGRL